MCAPPQQSSEVAGYYNLLETPSCLQCVFCVCSARVSIKYWIVVARRGRASVFLFVLYFVFFFRELFFWKLLAETTPKTQKTKMMSRIQ